MNDRARPPGAAPRSLRELLIIGTVLVAIFSLGAFTGVFERLSDWLLTREESGRVFALLTLVAVGGGVFAALRWRQAEIETRRRIDAQRRYRLLVEQAPVVIYAWDPTRPTGEVAPPFVSPQIESLLGFTPEEWTSDPTFWIRYVHPEDRDAVIAASDAANRDGGHFQMEYRALHRDGHVVWIHDEAQPVSWDADGKPTLVQGVMVDITRTRAAEDMQRETHRRFQALVERLPVVTYVEHAETERYEYLSPQIEEMTGYSRDRWLEDPGLWAKVLHPDDRERVLDEEAAVTGDTWGVDYRMIRADGRTVWVHNESVLIRDEDGKPLEWVGVCADLTELREASEQVRAAEERFRAIVEHIPAAVYLDRPDGTMESVYVSPQVEAVMGVSAQRYLDEPELWLDLMDEEDRRRCERTYLDAIERRRSWSDEYRIRRPDGALAWIHDETTLLTGADGEPLFLLGVLFDITERKRAEETLRESERRERDAAERLRALDDMKNTFLAAVSHELRSPLTSILGLSLTLERATDLTDEDRRDLIPRLSSNAQKLDRLLRDLLDLDRLNRGIVEPQRRPCDVAALARGTLASLEGLADRRVVVLADACPLEVDAAKVERIVENLLTNAARHTPTDGTIWLRVELTPDGALIAVDDEGPGVPEELRSTIFEPFRQGPLTSTPSSASGTGIGLSLVTRFAELHGGHAWVEGRPGGGASFRVLLPGPAPVAPLLASLDNAEAG